MESTQPSSNESIFDLAIDEKSTSYLNDMARWAKFLSIVGFILCGMIMMGAMLAASIVSEHQGYNRSTGFLLSVFAISSVYEAMVYIVIVLVGFFPLLYLYNFSTKMQVALRNNDQGHLHASFNNLRSCFKFVGILTIVILAFCVIGAILVISASALSR